jgi:hypothetical protein
MSGVFLHVRCRRDQNNKAPSAGERVDVVEQLLGAVGRKKEGRKKEANGVRIDERRCAERNKKKSNL